MDFALTAEQRGMQEEMVAFAASLGGDAAANDRDGDFDRESWRRCADEGVLSLAIPAEHNTTGANTDLVTAAVAMEARAAVNCAAANSAANRVSPSALLTAMMWTSSSSPRLMPCSSSPAPGSISAKKQSVMPATIVSDWPTPTVSTSTTS